MFLKIKKKINKINTAEPYRIICPYATSDKSHTKQAWFVLEGYYKKKTLKPINRFNNNNFKMILLFSECGSDSLPI